MNLLDIILLAVALAMDCFTVSIVSGVIVKSGHSQRSTLNYQLPLLFGLFQGLMPLIGWLGISSFSSYLEAVDHWIAFGLLAFIGGKMVKESFDEEDEQHFDPTLLRTQIILAVATSIDALAVGISFACTGYRQMSQLVLPLLIIGVVSFLFGLLGWWLGSCFGRRITQVLKPELLGGIILIGIGLKILATHLLSPVS